VASAERLAWFGPAAFLCGKRVRADPSEPFGGVPVGEKRPGRPAGEPAATFPASSNLTAAATL
jgi:hypothetical protein